jgi:hypothetical protein
MASQHQLRVLVATHVGQGLRSNDYCWTVEGELVLFGMECGSDRDDIDGRCGCRRAMAGAASSKATTTFRVAVVDMTFDQYREAIRASLERGGWISSASDAVECDDAAFVDQMVTELLDTARDFPVGAILEKRGDVIRLRAVQQIG